MRKHWRYVGVYGPQLMLCAGAASIGPAPQAWWAVWDREGERLHERTRVLGRGRVRLPDGRVLVRDGDVEIDLSLDGGEEIEVVTPDGAAYAWTSKRTPLARGSVRVAGRDWNIEGTAIVDDSDGYHARHTSWRWSAGCGRSADGRTLAWNLVEGIHDSPQASERTLWLDGRPGEVEPVRFDPGLAWLRFGSGEELRFSPEATRRRDDNLLLVRSRYEQPFGTFSGTLPGGVELAEGYGVMERHDAVW
jgi:hypothetical protein